MGPAKDPREWGMDGGWIIIAWAPNCVHRHDFTPVPWDRRGSGGREGPKDLPSTLHVLFLPSADFLAPAFDLEHSSQSPLIVFKEQGLSCLVCGFESSAWATRGSAVPAPQQGRTEWPKPTGLSPCKAYWSSAHCARWLVVLLQAAAHAGSATQGS